MAGATAGGAPKITAVALAALAEAKAIELETRARRGQWQGQWWAES